ncbi:MAG: hypothetical protein K2P28_05925, partial [Lachnospiraceae bacterium]|nr:hypothetical protein [Lachnospiraceae bacterium]
HSTGDSEEIAEQRNTIDLIYKKFACSKKNSDDGMAMEAVKELGERYKTLFKMDNARALLLETAKDYLDHSQLEEATDKQYGKGLQDISVRLFPGIMVKKFRVGVRITVTAILHISSINFCEFCVC